MGGPCVPAVRRGVWVLVRMERVQDVGEGLVFQGVRGMLLLLGGRRVWLRGVREAGVGGGGEARIEGGDDCSFEGSEGPWGVVMRGVVVRGVEMTRGRGAEGREVLGDVGGHLWDMEWEIV